MLHQDLRPGDAVMIDAQGTVKLIDLANAHVEAGRISPRRPRHRRTRHLQYTAPEYLLGEGGSQPGELFSLAAITYQLLTGQLPYGLDAARDAQPGRPAPPAPVPVRHLRPDLPAWVDAVLAKALSPQPDKRRR